MSRVGLSCPDCGSSSIVDDDLYCQPQRVCVDCGAVVSEGALAHDPVGGADVSYSRSTAAARKPCVNLIKGLQRVKAICQLLRVHREVEDLSLTHYQRSYLHERFIRVSLQKKELLAGCTVLVSCRLLNWPVTMATISCLLDADPMAVGAIYQEMVDVLNIEAPIINVTDVMEAHSQEYRIGLLHVPEELAESSTDLSKRAVALVELAADTWIVTGRKPVPIMMAATYLAWQSLKPNRQRLKLSLDKFCQIAKVHKHKPALKRVAEIKEVLCKLGQEIPWLREEVTPDNVVRQVEDILKHRYALLRSALRSHQDVLPAEQQAPCHGPEVSALSPNASSEHREASAGKLLPDAPENPRPAPHWGKRVLFAPPCVVHAKKRRAEPPELQDVTGEEDISDTEIDSYIRTPQEARAFALTQRMLLLSESDASPAEKH